MLVSILSNVLAKVVAFFYDVIVLQKKFQSRRKVHSLWVGLLFSSHSLYGRNTLDCRKRKGMPDTTVETTSSLGSFIGGLKGGGWAVVIKNMSIQPEGRRQAALRNKIVPGGVWT